MKGCICHLAKWKIQSFMSKWNISGLKSRYLLVEISQMDDDYQMQVNRPKLIINQLNSICQVWKDEWINEPTGSSSRQLPSGGSTMIQRKIHWPNVEPTLQYTPRTVSSSLLSNRLSPDSNAQLVAEAGSSSLTQLQLCRAKTNSSNCLLYK